MLEFLEELLEEQYGKELKEKIFQGYRAKRVVTFRVNTLKSSINEIEEKLKELLKKSKQNN